MLHLQGEGLTLAEQVALEEDQVGVQALFSTTSIEIHTASVQQEANETHSKIGALWIKRRGAPWSKKRIRRTIFT